MSNHAALWAQIGFPVATPGPVITAKNKHIYTQAILRQKWYRCEWCARLFRTTHRAGANRFCSRQCGWTGHYNIGKVCPWPRKDTTASKTCAVCQAWFFPSSGHNTICSDSCRRALAARKQRLRKSAHLHTGSIECRECGKAFVREKGSTGVAFCSKRCSRRQASRDSKHRRRSRKRGGHSIPLSMLIRRDKGLCQLCGGRVQRQTWIGLKWNPKAASIDHIKPLSVGGTHTWDNVQLANLKCNSEKSSETIGQMRLF